MFTNFKKSGEYLNQIKNDTENKTELIVENLKQKNLPANKFGIRQILELGTGGGESLQKIKNNLPDKTELIAVDIIPELSKLVKQRLGINSITADAAHLPFKNESLSAINASAILHEISSYGIKIENKRNYGINAVKQSLLEIKRVLMPNGLLSYRDISPPLNNLFLEKTVAYTQPSWKKFAKWFMPDFLQTGPNFYKQNNINTADLPPDGLIITAPCGFHRELQRHYLMFRDYARNVMKEKFGVIIHRLTWINETEGLKHATLSIIKPELKQFLNNLNFTRHDSYSGEIIKMNSDDLDELYDKILNFYFEKINDNNLNYIEIKKHFDNWKKREGNEYYIYSTPTDLIMLTYDPRSKDILFPEKSSDIKLTPRYYYNRYLKKIIDYPEFDGKIILGLRKMPYKKINNEMLKKFSEDSEINQIINFKHVAQKLNL